MRSIAFARRCASFIVGRREFANAWIATARSIGALRQPRDDKAFRVTA
jgi:hypothetical protein